MFYSGVLLFSMDNKCDFGFLVYGEIGGYLSALPRSMHNLACAKLHGQSFTLSNPDTHA